ncbi:MAG: kelch repeat-containing protein [Pseudomonadota bacterium]
MNRRQFVQSGLLAFAAPMAMADTSPWRSAAPIPINTQELYPAVHQGRLYVAGGIAAKLGVPYFTNACYSYDHKRDEWRAEADLPMDLHHAALVSTGQQLFLVGGFNGAYTHTWRMQSAVYELTTEGWQAQTALPAPQAEGVLSTASDGAIHLVTGQSPRGEANSKRSDHREVVNHWRWQPGDSRWLEAAPIPTPRNSATGGWYGDQLIVSGGRTARGNLSETEIYDAREDKWRSAAPLPLPQAGTAGAMSDEGLIVFGGEIFQPRADVFKEVWHYRFSSDSWEALADMPTPRHGNGAGRIGNDIYVIGGATKPGGSGTSNLNEVYALGS